MRRHSTAAFAAAAVVLVLAAGCGGKKASSRSSSSSGGTTTSSSSSSGTGSFTSTKNCAQLASLASKVAQSMKSTGNAKKDIDNEVKLFDALADAAPGEIKSDLKTFADAFHEFATTYSGAGITMGQAPTAAQLAKLQKAAAAFSAPKVRAAEQHLSSWSRKNCGLSATNP